MSQSDDHCPTPDCPANNNDCPLIAELQQLRELARTDSLTGLFNQRHFRDALLQEMERTQRSHNPTSLMFIDLDFFKQVNDTHGHEVGNLALQHLANLLTNNLRRLDVAARYGGEEFVVILPGTDLFTGRMVAERIRGFIENNHVAIAGGELKLTASIGIDVYRSGDSDDIESFVARADKLLYQAKRGGRNRVVNGIADLSLADQVNQDEKAALAAAFNAGKNDQQDS